MRWAVPRDGPRKRAFRADPAGYCDRNTGADQTPRQGVGSTELETQEIVRATKRYVLDVKLEDGEVLQADLGGDLELARTQLDALVGAAATDILVRVGGNAVVRARDIRYARVRDEDEDGGGLVDVIKSRVGGSMSTYGTERTGSRTVGVGARGGDGGGHAEPLFGGTSHGTETKPFFLTSEFLALVGAIAGVAIAMQVLDNFNANRGWLLITILAAAYMVSRGIAKAGTRSWSGDPRESRGDWR